MNISVWMYISSFVCVMIVPFVMFIVGGRYAENPPEYQEMGVQWSGYRVGRADRSRETWEFSQKYFWSKAAWIAFLEIAGSIVVIIKYWERILAFSFQLEIVVVQVVLVMLPAIPTEIMLHKMFDKNGKRKS